jgi:hypothetical protein
MLHVIHYDLKDIPLQEFAIIKPAGANPPFYVAELTLTMRLARTLQMELRCKSRVISATDVAESKDATTGASNANQFLFPLSQLIVDQSTLPTYAKISAQPNQGRNFHRDYDRQALSTDGRSLPELGEKIKDKAISMFGLKILDSTKSLFLDLETASEWAAKRSKISEALPGLLEEFSSELRLLAQLGIQRNAAIFVRRHRRYLQPFILSATNLLEPNFIRYSVLSR